jgi:hypothetical protein
MLRFLYRYARMDTNENQKTVVGNFATLHDAREALQTRR